jgi:hypothetical protein
LRTPAPLWGRSSDGKPAIAMYSHVYHVPYERLPMRIHGRANKSTCTCTNLLLDESLVEKTLTRLNHAIGPPRSLDVPRLCDSKISSATAQSKLARTVGCLHWCHWASQLGEHNLHHKSIRDHRKTQPLTRNVWCCFKSEHKMGHGCLKVYRLSRMEN